jgi:hypothetical protein
MLNGIGITDISKFFRVGIIGGRKLKSMRMGEYVVTWCCTLFDSNHLAQKVLQGDRLHKPLLR